MAKSCREPRGWSSIIQAVDTEDQGCCLAFFFPIWPFDGTWLISLVLPFAKMDDEQKELQSGVSVAFEKLTFKAVRLPRARQLWLQKFATAFYPEQMHTCLHLIEIRVCLPSVQLNSLNEPECVGYKHWFSNSGQGPWVIFNLSLFLS